MVQLDNCVKYFKRLILDELKPICITWVAGGCVRDYFSIGKLTSDIDLFFTCVEDFEKCKKYLIDDKTRRITRTEPADNPEDDDKIIIEVVDKPQAKVIFENDNVLKVSYRGHKFDVIKKYFPSPETTIIEFDFTVCCAAVDLGRVYTHETFFIDLAKRQLMINKLPFPLSTMWRLQKYINKGFYICSGEMLKLSKAIGALQTNTEEGEKANIDLQPVSGEDDIRFTTFD
jgi:hypothetical protein